MSRLSKKRRIKRIVYSKPVVVLLLILAILVTRASWNSYQNMVETGVEARRAQEEQAKLLEKRQVLEQKIERIETQEGVEEELRERFSAAKEGERMIVIVDEKPTTTNESKEDRGWLRNIWSALTGIFR